MVALSVVSFMLNAGVNNQTLAVLVNSNDPESIIIAKYYQQARLIPEKNMVYLNFKNTDILSEDEFNGVAKQLKHKVPGSIQAYALAWRKPWRVSCMSITSAISLGFDKTYCALGCKATKTVDYYGSKSMEPFTDYAIRPSMLLSANSVSRVKQLIDRGVSADYGRPDGTAYLLNTGDKERNVRAVYYSSIKKRYDRLLNIELISGDAIKYKNDVMFYFTGLSRVGFIEQNNFLAGAIADHLTSTGGQLFSGNQMSVLEWIDAGVTGTYGTVVEPCNFRQKFPHPEIVMRKYMSGESLVEAYWKSVQMPGQGVFVGEPLSAPYKGCKLKMTGLGVYQYISANADNYVEMKYKNCD